MALLITTVPFAQASSIHHVPRNLDSTANPSALNPRQLPTLTLQVVHTLQVGNVAHRMSFANPAHQGASQVVCDPSAPQLAKVYFDKFSSHRREAGRLHPYLRKCILTNFLRTAEKQLVRIHLRLCIFADLIVPGKGIPRAQSTRPCAFSTVQ